MHSARCRGRQRRRSIPRPPGVRPRPSPAGLEARRTNAGRAGWRGAGGGPGAAHLVCHLVALEAASWTGAWWQSRRWTEHLCAFLSSSPKTSSGYRLIQMKPPDVEALLMRKLPSLPPPRALPTPLLGPPARRCGCTVPCNDPRACSALPTLWWRRCIVGARIPSLLAKVARAEGEATCFALSPCPGARS